MPVMPLLDTCKSRLTPLSSILSSLPHSLFDNFCSQILISKPNKMEPSISSLTYKGSIPEAILESKKQKKLFVVFISGKNAESTELEQSTWSNSKVAESLSKYCILLHIPEGGNDATNFLAIYPQKSAPCITAIGYNGVQLWQSEGFISAEVLASSLEKAWLSLHIQETTATVLTAELASPKCEPPSSTSSEISSSGQGSSSGRVVPSISVDRHIQPSEVVRQAASDQLTEGEKSQEPITEETITELDDSKSSKSSNIQKTQTVGNMSSCPNEDDKKLPSPSMIKSDSIVADHQSPGTEDVLTQEKIISNHSGVHRGDSELTTAETGEAGRDQKAERKDGMALGTSDNNPRVNASSDVYLNIRMPDGASLQEKFSVTNTLRMVKDYVDRNQASGIAPYDLAIPYPRKIFGDQDLSKSLSELALLNRQALIVVPRQRAAIYNRGGSSSSDQATTTAGGGPSDANDGGYFAFVKRILSYVNPLSYFGGSASSSNSGQSQSSIWEYGPNSTPQNNTAGMDRLYSGYSPDQSSTSRNESKGRQTTSSRFGSNIHTLKHDEDGRFNDRNSFWNGNSTQYGGNSDDK